MARRRAMLYRRRECHALALGLGSLLLLLSHADPASARRPERFPNQIPYRQTGAQPARGSAGNVNLTARALLGRGGHTDLELTTGAFDVSQPPSGSLARVQLKAFNSRGGVRFVRNEAVTGASANLEERRLQHREVIQVQAIAHASGTRRAGKVTLHTPVVLRPDLRAADLATPERAVVRTPVIITALVQELNQDLGARADVVLLADGVEVDRADSIWVDARGTVSIAFSHTFTTPGVKRLSVQIEQVRPGDYDPRNNLATAELEVVAPGRPLDYHATVEDYEYHRHSHSGSHYRAHDGSYANEWSNTVEDSGWAQRAEVNFSAPKAASFPLANVTLRHQTNDLEHAVLSFDHVAPTFENVENNGRVLRRSTGINLEEPGFAFYLTTIRETDLLTGAVTELTSGQHFRTAGEVTYFSSGHSRVWTPDFGEDRSTWSSNQSSQWGERASFGDDYRMEVQITDAAGELFLTAPIVQLAPDEITVAEPRTETVYDDGWGVLTSVFESTYWRRGRFGVTMSSAP